MPEREFRQAWRLYRSKGPVNMPTAQQTWVKAARVIEPLLSPEELRGLHTARNHAHIGEGREEWDDLCRKVNDRIPFSELLEAPKLEPGQKLMDWCPWCKEPVLHPSNNESTIVRLLSDCRPGLRGGAVPTRYVHKKCVVASEITDWH